jgi:Tol biopolymer transport system component
MRRFLRGGYAPVVALAVVIAGCGQPVREDRSINWSGDGKAVGFQHGAEGVFIAGKDGCNLTKIYQPGPEILVTSTPLWSPDGRQAIFTTAQNAGDAPRASIRLPNAGSDPAGNVYTQQPIKYTCWLYEKSKNDRLPAPTALFEAICDHVGYVAANLAVRWHPRGKHVFYVQEVAPQQHALFVYDLTKHSSRQVTPHASEAFIFDWTPDGSNLVCVLGSRQRTDTDGIWIGQPDADDWWHVPDSGDLACPELPSALESLRATRPAWTPDSKRFAFVSYVPSPSQANLGRSTLRVGNLLTRTAGILAEGTEPFRDLHWSPDGKTLGMFQLPGSLRVVAPGVPLSAPINQRPVRQFAGWNASGDRLAYVTPDPIPYAPGDYWAFLFVPDSHGRDAVFVADGLGKEPGHEVFSGLRVTFPQWSPREDKLSLWATFCPPYRSWVSIFLAWGLRPGDPAAILDMKTGRLDWLAVNAHEKIQVGHYYLYKRDYAEAWRWYAQGERELPPPQPPTLRQFLGRLLNASGPENASFFEWYCLNKLGRAAEAKAKLNDFKRTFLPTRSDKLDPELDPSINGDALVRFVHELIDERGFFAPLLRDLYAAEVLLSLAAASDAEEYFRREMDQGSTEGRRLSSAIVFSQLLLLQKRYDEYADVMSGKVLPLLLPRFESHMPAAVAQWPEFGAAIQAILLLPLYSPDFYARLTQKQVETLLPRWEALRSKIVDESSRLAIDLMLRAAYLRLGRANEAQAVGERITQSAFGSRLPTSLEEIGKGIADMRAQIRAMAER